MITTLSYDIYNNGIGQHIMRRKLISNFKDMEQLEKYRQRLEKRLVKVLGYDDIMVTFIRGDHAIKYQSWFKRMAKDIDKAVNK